MQLFMVRLHQIDWCQFINTRSKPKKNQRLQYSYNNNGNLSVQLEININKEILNGEAEEGEN